MNRLKTLLTTAGAPLDLVSTIHHYSTGKSCIILGPRTPKHFASLNKCGYESGKTVFY